MSDKSSTDSQQKFELPAFPAISRLPVSNQDNSEQPCPTYYARLEVEAAKRGMLGYFCATVGQMTEEMIKEYLEHHFEPNPNDNFKMEPD